MGLVPLECAAPEEPLRAHDMENKDMLAVKPIEDAAGRFYNLAVTRARSEFLGAAPTFRVVRQLSNVLDNPLNERSCGSQVLKGDVISDRLQVSDGGFRPDYLSHLERRFSV